MKYKIKVNNKMRSFGETDPKKKLIQINKKKAKSTKKRGELLNTIVHEKIHAKSPKMKEKIVIKKTMKVMKKMTKKQKAKTYKKLK